MSLLKVAGLIIAGIFGLGVLSAIYQAAVGPLEKTSAPLQVASPAAAPGANPSHAKAAFANETEARAFALKKYPQLAVAGSPLNLSFLQIVNREKKVHPERFKDPSWVPVLADEAAAQIATR